MDIKRLYEALEQEISSLSFKTLYQEIIDKHKTMSRFQNPEALRNFLHHDQDDTKEHYDLNDEILHTLIYLYQQSDHSQSLASFLLILFRPGLINIFRSYQRKCLSFYELDDMDLWGQIVESFLEVLNQKDLLFLRPKVSFRVLGRVRNRLRIWFKAKLAHFLSSVDEERVPDPSSSDRSGIVNLEMLLHQLVLTKVINQAEKEIIFASRIEGKTLKELSLKMGLNHATVKQRRYRAEKAIRNYLIRKDKEDKKLS